MMRLMTNFVGSSLAVFLISCSSVQRPDALICGVNAVASKLRCYNIKTDFDNDGVLIPGVKPKIIPFVLHDLNGGIFFSAQDFEKVKVWIADMRAWSKSHCQ